MVLLLKLQRSFLRHLSSNPDSYYPGKHKDILMPYYMLVFISFSLVSSGFSSQYFSSMEYGGLVLPLVLEPDPRIYRSEELMDELRKKVHGLEEAFTELASRVKSQGSELKNVTEELSSISARMISMEAFYHAASLIGGWKAETCIHNDNGVCVLWRVSGEAHGKLSDVVVKSEDGIARVKVSSAPWFCGLCPLYTRRR